MKQRSKCNRERCPFTEAALLLHEGCLKGGMCSDPSNQDPTQEWLCPTQRGWRLHGLNQSRTQSWCYSVSAAHGNHREASKMDA